MCAFYNVYCEVYCEKCKNQRIQCTAYTVSVLGRDEGYTVKYNPLPEGVPEGIPKGKGYI